MKKLSLLLLIGVLPFLAFPQSNKPFWIEIDGVYWEKNLSIPDSFSPEKNRFGSLRPMLGWNFETFWSIGLMGNYQSYYQQQQDLSIFNPIYENVAADADPPLVIGYTESSAKTGMNNEYFAWGIFLRRNIQLGKKTFLNLNLYGMRETGKNGQFEIYPAYNYYWFYSCPNCLSTTPEPIEIGFAEKNWRYGLDLAFSWQLRSWMDLGFRANFLEFRKQSVIDKRGPINTLVYDPFWASIQGFFGDRYDFGSTIPREGIRLSLTFSLF